MLKSRGNLEMIDDIIISNDMLETLIAKHKKSGVDTPFELGMVLYTDGSSKPPYAGYGVHGYIYANTPSKTGCGVNGYTSTNRGYVVTAANHKAAKGFDIRTNSEDQVKLDVQQVTPIVYINAFGAMLDATNNVAELEAFNVACDVAVECFRQNLPIKQIHFILDSKYVIGSVVRRNKYIENNMTGSSGKPLANADQIRAIYAKLIPMLNVNCDYYISWTEGHADDFGNIQADKLAGSGTVAASNGSIISGMTYSPSSGFWSKGSKIDISNNPGLNLLLDMNWYEDSQLDTLRRSDSMTALYVGTHSEPSKIGQRDPNSIKGVVLLNSVPVVMDKLRDYARKLDAVQTSFETYGPFFGAVDTLLKPDIEEYITEYGDSLFISDAKKKVISTHDQRELLSRISPCATAPAAFDAWMMLHRLLEDYRDDKIKESSGYKVTDVTATFYETTVNGKGKATTKLLLGNENSIDVAVDVLYPFSPTELTLRTAQKLTLTIGITAPKRRVFSNIKDFNPKVLVLTNYEYSLGYRNYLIIVLESGDCGIWTNPDANYKIL